MKIKIYVAKSYDDLPKDMRGTGIFENNKSPSDVKDTFDLLLNNNCQIVLVTLHDDLLNILGIYIEKNKLNASDIVVDIYEKGKYLRSARYTEDGYLDENWIFGLLNFEVK